MARHDLTSILDEGFEEIILGRSQLDLLPVDLHEALGKINFEWTSRKNWLLVISTQIKSLHFVTLGILDREHNDGQIRLLTNPLSHF